MFRSVNTLIVTAAVVCALVLRTPPAWCQSEDDLKAKAFEKEVKKAGLINAIVQANGKVAINPELLCAKVDQVVSIVAVGLNINDEDMETIATFPNLRLLDLQGTEVTDKGVAFVKEMKTLRRLALRGTQVTDEALKHVQGLTGLELLSVGHTRVSDKGLAFIKGLGGLRTLDLENTAVTDKGLQHLTGMSQLAVLHLDQTRVTEQGVAALAKALPKAKVLWQPAGDRKSPQPMPQETAAQRRQRLQDERAALEQNIVLAEQEIASNLETAARADADADELKKEKPPRLTSIIAIQGTAQQARNRAAQLRGEIRKDQERIRAIDKALGETTQEPRQPETTGSGSAGAAGQRPGETLQGPRQPGKPPVVPGPRQPMISPPPP